MSTNVQDDISIKYVRSIKSEREIFAKILGKKIDM